ncbi:hypothetical protein QLQ12_27325 [Actinoplanes sp. NEAU-A12]|uniref:Uncharacterized protein n=1 Tax=Actinoplanes sandaracinus TaxID=3045177 RepID=A0ABT6WRS5_9ACTN|nr:hypothetical protein [Actinoplanes sandaracinus]MDI6102335.1 hypothetical protein [Actinoplanes sandaracinus]
MTSTPLPPYAEQTRALLWIQLMINMVGILFVVFVVVNFWPTLPANGGVHAYTAIGGLLFGGLLSAAAAKMFPRGRASAWVVAALAQAFVLAAVWAVGQLGLILGVGILVTLGTVGWIGVNLCRAQVRRHFFSSGARRPTGQPLDGQPLDQGGRTAG